MFEDAFKGIKKLPKRKRQKDNYRNSQAARMKKTRTEDRDIGRIPDIVDQDRRASCKMDYPLFCVTYLPVSFYNPFTAPQKVEMGRLQYSVLHKELFAIAAPRADGKTTRAEAGILWGMLYGHIRFGVGIGADHEISLELMEWIKVEIETNELLLEDFPEVCFPVRELEGITLRANGQLCEGERTYIKWGKRKIVFPTIPGSVCSGAVMVPRGLTSRVRGLQHKKPNGETVRPDFVALDDPQTEKSANSVGQCEAREKTIRSAVMGLAAPGQQIGAAMLCTIIRKGDLSDRMLDTELNPEWRGQTTSMFITFPDDLDYWEDVYKPVFIESIEQEDHDIVNKFYLANRERLEKGAAISNEWRLGEFDISAIQHAMHLYFKVGRAAFMSEYQNAPEDETATHYNLTADIVARRLSRLPRLELPKAASIVTAFGDINFIGINYAVIGFKNDFTAAIVDYGKSPEGRRMLFNPEKSGKTTEAQAITKGIYDFIRLLADRNYTQDGKRVNIDVLEIDGNFMPDTVHDAVQNATVQIRPPFKLVVNRGRGHKQYKVPRDKARIIGQAGDHCHLEKDDRGRQIVQDSDYWRMTVQKALLDEPGVPGSLAIYGKNHKDHDRISKEVAGEKLSNYAITDQGPLYNWTRTPGINNDLLDAVVGCYSAASLLGATLTGGEMAWRKRKPKGPRRKAKVQIKD